MTLAMLGLHVLDEPPVKFIYGHQIHMYVLYVIDPPQRLRYMNKRVGRLPQDHVILLTSLLDMVALSVAYGSDLTSNSLNIVAIISPCFYKKHNHV